MTVGRHGARTPRLAFALVCGLVAGCSNTRVSSDAAGRRISGFRYHDPKPYLLVTRSTATDEVISVQKLILPDTSPEGTHYVAQMPGIGATGFTVETTNGVLKTLTTSTDSQAAATANTTAAGLKSVIDALVAAKPVPEPPPATTPPVDPGAGAGTATPPSGEGADVLDVSRLARLDTFLAKVQQLPVTPFTDVTLLRTEMQGLPAFQVFASGVDSKALDSSLLALGADLRKAQAPTYEAIVACQAAGTVCLKGLSPGGSARPQPCAERVTEARRLVRWAQLDLLQYRIPPDPPDPSRTIRWYSMARFAKSAEPVLQAASALLDALGPLALPPPTHTAPAASSKPPCTMTADDELKKRPVYLTLYEVVFEGPEAPAKLVEVKDKARIRAIGDVLASTPTLFAPRVPVPPSASVGR